MSKFIIEKHSTIDKSFNFGNGAISMKVDYDDVNHIEVDIAIEMIKDILDKNWDDKLFKNKKMERAIKIWKENKYNLQSDYLDFDEYIEPYK